MKKKENARDRREAETLRRKGTLGCQSLPAESKVAKEPIQKASGPKPPQAVKETPEEATRAFLDWLDQYDMPQKEEDADKNKTGRTGKGQKPEQSESIPILNLEKGMPIVEEALNRLRMGLQEFRHSGFKIIKLIHGYGSTGRGGKIRTSVQKELIEMKRKKLIRDYIPGEEFGPLNETTRKLAEQQKSITKDPDYGRMNPGIALVIL